MTAQQESKLDKLFTVMSRIEKKMQVTSLAPPEYVTEAEAIALLGKGKRTLQNMRRNGEVGFTSIHGRDIMYLKSDLHKLLYTNATKFSL